MADAGSDSVSVATGLTVAVARRDASAEGDDNSVADSEAQALPETSSALGVAATLSEVTALAEPPMDPLSAGDTDATGDADALAPSGDTLQEPLPEPYKGDALKVAPLLELNPADAVMAEGDAQEEGAVEDDPAPPEPLSDGDTDTADGDADEDTRRLGDRAADTDPLALPSREAVENKDAVAAGEPESALREGALLSDDANEAETPAVPDAKGVELSDNELESDAQLENDV